MTEKEGRNALLALRSLAADGPYLRIDNLNHENMTRNVSAIAAEHGFRTIVFGTMLVEHVIGVSKESEDRKFAFTIITNLKPMDLDRNMVIAITRALGAPMESADWMVDKGRACIASWEIA